MNEQEAAELYSKLQKGVSKKYVQDLIDKSANAYKEYVRLGELAHEAALNSRRAYTAFTNIKYKLDMVLSFTVTGGDVNRFKLTDKN